MAKRKHRVERISKQRRTRVGEELDGLLPRMIRYRRGDEPDTAPHPAKSAPSPACMTSGWPGNDSTAITTTFG